MKLASIAVLSVALLAVPAFAQTGDVPPPPPSGTQDHGGPGMHRGGSGMGHHMPMTTRVVPITNAPFSAKYTLESVYTAPGPDSLVQKFTTTHGVYRDSLGRTREDLTMPTPPQRRSQQSTDEAPAAPKPPATPRLVTIIADPVANTITRLMADKKTAVVETVPADFFKHAVAREASESVNGPVRHDAGPASTDLGSKTFAGVVASGKRTTFTVHVRGGDKASSAAPESASAAAPAARAMTHEMWFSPDLKLEVSSTETSGRGTRSDVLTSLTKGEPDAALFKVPEGYTVKNAPPHMPGGMHRGGHGPGGPGNPGGPDAPPPPPAM